MDRRERIRDVIAEQSFELFISLALFAAGTWALLGHTNPSSVSATLPLWLQITWRVSVVVGSLFVLIGIFGRSTSDNWYVKGLVIEDAGWKIIASSLASFVVTIIAYVPIARGAFTAGLCTGLALACLGRNWSIKKSLHALAGLTRERTPDGNGD